MLGNCHFCAFNKSWTFRANCSLPAPCKHLKRPELPKVMMQEEKKKKAMKKSLEINCDFLPMSQKMVPRCLTWQILKCLAGVCLCGGGIVEDAPS